MNDNHAAACRARLDALERDTGKCSWTAPDLIGSGYPLFSFASCIRHYMVRAQNIGLVTLSKGTRKTNGKGSRWAPVNIYTYIKSPSGSVTISPPEASIKPDPVTNQKVLRPADIRIQLDGIYYEQCIANMLLLSAADERERYAEEIRSSSPIQEHAHV